MRISVSTGTLFIFPIPKIFEMAAAAGFDGLELIINQDFEHVDSPKLLAELSAILPILSIHAPFMSLAGWGNPIDSLKRSVDLAVAAGVPLVNFHPPSWMGLDLSFWRWMYRIQDFQKEVGGGAVTLTLENMPWEGRLKINEYILSQSEKMVEFITERNLDLTFDCTHLGSGKTNFINDFYLFYGSGRVRNIHFSDYGYGRQHLLPGRGVLPLTRFLNHLRTLAYDETLTLELFPKEFPKDERVIVESLKEILQYLRRETARSAGDGVSSPSASPPGPTAPLAAE
jgi:sugar phosphate isomerase/epimerase